MKEPEFVDAFRLLVSKMCTHPKDLEVRYVPGRHQVLSITPHAADFGLVCGRAGRNLESLRVITKAMADKAGVEDITVLLEESTMGERGPVKRAFVPNPDWDSDEFDLAVSQVARVVFTGKFVTSYETLGASDTKLVLAAQSLDQPQPGLERALGQVFATIAAAGGMRLIFELDVLETDATP